VKHVQSCRHRSRSRRNENGCYQQCHGYSLSQETDSLGEVDVPATKLWGAQTQRSLEHFSIGHVPVHPNDDKASKIAHYALDKNLTLKQAALELGFVSEDQFDRVVDPAKMVHPYVATSS
jgi:fumarate hydratase class II